MTNRNIIKCEEYYNDKYSSKTKYKYDIYKTNLINYTICIIISISIFNIFIIELYKITLEIQILYLPFIISMVILMFLIYYLYYKKTHIGVKDGI